jgi:hypothetical protein
LGVRKFWKIWPNYIFRGTFIIDLLALFPFLLIFGNDAIVTKLIRLFRIPKLLQMLDIGKFNQILNTFLGGGTSRQEKLKTHFILTLVFYRIFSLAMRAIIVTYFLGSLWYLTSKNVNPGWYET